MTTNGTRDLLIGIDAGTSVIKSVVFDTSGQQLDSAALPNRYETLPGGGAEQDLARTWADTATTLRQLTDRIPDLASRTIAIAVTGQGDGTWLIDKDGEPVGKGWLWLDARAASIVEEIRKRPEDRMRFEKTGTGLAACQQGPQLVHMSRTTPEILERATTAFHCQDWLYFRLTGQRATDPSQGVFSFGDLRTRNYDQEVIDVFGLTGLRRLLPPIVDGARESAGLSAAAASASGLRAGTPVVLGYVDVACTALGAGLYEKGTDTGCSIVGSTGMHMRFADRAADVWLNEGRTGYTMCLPVKGAYTQMQSNMAATLNIDWIINVAGGLLKGMGIEKSKAELLGQVDRWLAEASGQPVLFHPYISEAGERGPFVDVSARASFVGLNIGHGFGDLVRAVFDGLAYSARDCYAEMGPMPARVRLSGGAARSASLRAILGGALDTGIQTSEREEAGAAGAAMIAAVSLGIYDDMDDCVRDWVSPSLRPVEAPDPALVSRFDAGFAAYRMTRQVLHPVWHAMADGSS